MTPQDLLFNGPFLRQRFVKKPCSQSVILAQISIWGVELPFYPFAAGCAVCACRLVRGVLWSRPDLRSLRREWAQRRLGLLQPVGALPSKKNAGLPLHYWKLPLGDSRTNGLCKSKGLGVFASSDVRDPGTLAQMCVRPMTSSFVLTLRLGLFLRNS